MADPEADSVKQQIFESEVIIMGKFADYLKKNQVEIVLALYALNMNVNSFQGYELTRVLPEK